MFICTFKSVQDTTNATLTGQFIRHYCWTACSSYSSNLSVRWDEVDIPFFLYCGCLHVTWSLIKYCTIQEYCLTFVWAIFYFYHMAVDGHKNRKQRNNLRIVKEDLCMNLSSIPATISGLCSIKREGLKLRKYIESRRLHCMYYLGHFCLMVHRGILQI